VIIGQLNGEGNTITDDAIGIAALGGSVSEVDVVGNRIGPLPSGSTADDTGDGIGLYAGQGMSGLTIGSSTSGGGNVFQDDSVGAVIAGLTGPKVLANTFGADEGYTASDHRTNLLGLAVLDSSGVTVGGTGSAGNQLTGDAIGVLVAGKNSTGNTVTGNVIGRATDLRVPTSQLEQADMGSVFGVLLAGGSGNVVTGNTVRSAGLGIGIAASSSNIVTSNTVTGNFVGIWAINGAGNAIGAAGAGNTIGRNNVGVLVSDQNLATAEQGFAGLPATSDAVQSDREQALDAAADQDELDFATAASSATVGASTMDVPSGSGSGDTVQGNTIGGAGQGNDVGAILAGDVSGTVVGGIAADEANTIADGHEAGVWIIGPAGHEPSVAVLGNSIFDNYDGSIPDDKPGLGIDLVGLDASGAGLPGDGFGPNAANHSVQPDPNGPNGLQNYPILTGAVPSGGTVAVTGTLTSAARRSYRVELFADVACSPFGYGEGQQLLGSVTVVTGAGGVGSFSETVPRSLSGAKVVTATATSLVGGVPTDTSEFSACETIGPRFAGAHATGGSETLSGPTVTVTITCPAGSPGSCSGSSTLTTTTESSDLRVARAAKKKKLVVLARARFSIKAGRSARVKLRLSRAGQKLVTKDRTLRTTITVLSHAGASQSVTRTATLTLRAARRR
jgi:parallel beta-helix repeat protein